MCQAGSTHLHTPHPHTSGPRAGLWSLIKRAPKATKKRKVFEVEGPGKEGGIPLDVRARAIFQYFKKYNSEVKETGDVIRFVGNYQASRGQAAALVFYTFLGEKLGCLLRA